jgi:SHS2 domain-containing protein
LTIGRRSLRIESAQDAERGATAPSFVPGCERSIGVEMAIEVFDHTADIGVRVTAASLEQLFAEAGRAIASLVIENPGAVELRQAVTIELEAEDLEGLFVDWLSELIYRFEAEHLLLREFSVHVGDSSRRLRAECRGEPVDWSRHRPAHELKAATYHQLRVAQTTTGWEANVILDI